jgi:hypothetical protein
VFNEYYGLVQPEQLVIVRSYGDDTDDQVLAEIRPRFIIMYEPNLDFVRRIEVSRPFVQGGFRSYIETGIPRFDAWALCSSICNDVGYECRGG